MANDEEKKKGKDKKKTISICHLKLDAIENEKNFSILLWNYYDKRCDHLTSKGGFIVMCLLERIKLKVSHHFNVRYECFVCVCVHTFEIFFLENF